MAKINCTALIAFFLLSFSVQAQVTIAPTNLFIDGNSRFGTYIVINGSNETQEISIDFMFQYTQTNVNGDRSIVDDDVAIEEAHSIAEHVRAFPKNFTLAPGQRQVVRLRVSAPNDLDDGTYWARIKTASQPEAPPIEIQQQETVSAQVSIRIEQITGLFYKTGNVSTGIVLEGFRTSQENDQLTVLADVKREGNTPFLGTITTKLLDGNGRIVKEAVVSTTIYFDGVFRQFLDIKDLSPGNYSLSMEFATNRSDISENDIVQMQPVIDRTTITIQ